MIVKKEKRKRKSTYQIMDFATPTDHRVKLNKSEKRYKYLDLARELKNWEVKVSVIPILMVHFEQSPKDW